MVMLEDTWDNGNILFQWGLIPTSPKAQIETTILCGKNSELLFQCPGIAENQGDHPNSTGSARL
jgi:hypothetical protein